MSKTQPARGMRDFLPADVRRRDYVIGVIRHAYELFGFEPLETPAVENIDTLMGKYGEEGNQLIFKILKRGAHESTGQADLALRYDLTVPLARVVAEYKNALPKFFKRYQIQPVWRADRPARGRFREFYQCDVDALGSKSMIVEAELCGAVSTALESLGFRDFNVKLNHRAVLNGILDASGIAGDRHSDALIAIDKLDKIGRQGVASEFESRGIDAESGKRLLDFFEGLAELGHAADIAADSIEGESPIRAMNEAVLGRLVEFVGDHATGAAGIDELREILELCRSNPAGIHAKLDPSLARGLSYYTGAIMEISVADLSGSLGGGGRYDNLVGMFSGQGVPACGFSLGLERIIVVMTERGMFPPSIADLPADVMASVWNSDSRTETLKVATELRNAGIRVDVYPDDDKLGKQFKYAASRGIPRVAVVGDDERASGKISIKDMNTGEQIQLLRSEAPTILKEIISGARQKG